MFIRLAAWIDCWIRRIASVAAWFNAVLMVVIIVQVVLRYVFGRGLVVLEEIQWHLYAVAFMLGLSYVLVQDTNIRLDILRTRFSERTRESIEVIGILVLLLPMVAVFFFPSLDFVGNAWRLGERSDAPMGLPWRWAIKAVIPLSFALLSAAAFSRLIKGVRRLFVAGQEGGAHGGQ